MGVYDYSNILNINRYFDNETKYSTHTIISFAAGIKLSSKIHK